MPWGDQHNRQYCCKIRSWAEAIACPKKVESLARSAGFGKRSAMELEIATSELATNILHHGVSGSITAQVVDAPIPGIVLTAEDEGPGIYDIEHARQDGVSKGKVLSEEVPPPVRESLGSGLGALERLMDSVDIANAEGGGSRIVAFKAAKQ